MAKGQGVKVTKVKCQDRKSKSQGQGRWLSFLLLEHVEGYHCSMNIIIILLECLLRNP